ncbi:VOC family protein [Aeromicrobium sp. P5_D10]
MSNLVVHFEINASDPEELIEFYSELLGWKFEQWGEMSYWGIDTGEGSVRNDTEGGTKGLGINGGLTQRPGPRPEPGSPVNGCNVVVAVDDVDELFARGIELGGSQALAPETMPGVGRLAYLLDPDGNVFGLLTPTM